MEGKTLKHAISGQPLEMEQVLELGAQVADALYAGFTWKNQERFSNHFDHTSSPVELNLTRIGLASCAPETIHPPSDAGEMDSNVE